MVLSVEVIKNIHEGFRHFFPLLHLRAPWLFTDQKKSR